jgi:Fic family protein
MARKKATFSNIQALRERYYKALPGKDSLVKILNDTEIPEHVYNSNAIENSTLTLDETEKILLQIDLDRYVTDREVFEARNLGRVMEYLESKAKSSELSLPVILLLHKMLLSHIRDDVAGRFRSGDEWVRVGTHIGANPKEVEQLLTNMLTRYHTDPGEHIVTRVARFHLEFEHIHPFIDGNGRMGRVLNNYLLIREGYVPINITFSSRAEYYNAFKTYDTEKDSKSMEKMVGRALSASYHKRLAYLEGKEIITLRDYAKRHKESHANFINKAKRQTIEAFLEKGIWKIGA